MGNYAVFRTPIFDKKLKDFSDQFKKQVENIERQLENNPYVGQPLGTKWFREKRLGVYRMYYLIYEDLKAVYVKMQLADECILSIQKSRQTADFSPQKHKRTS